MNTPNIFFGKAADFPASFKDVPAFVSLLEHIAEKLEIPQLTISHQIHGVAGRVVIKQPQIQPVIVDYKSHDGDYLITSEHGIAIGVHTADCLPLIFYAPDKQVVAAAHAGWKGSVAGIGTVVIERLVQDFDIDIKQLKIWFGPAGGVCCYEVKDDFIVALEKAFGNKNATASLTEKRDGKIFFNNSELNRQQLIAAGVDECNIDRSNNHCTICNHEYHSYRRASDKSLYNSQATIVWLE